MRTIHAQSTIALISLKPVLLVGLVSLLRDTCGGASEACHVAVTLARPPSSELATPEWWLVVEPMDGAVWLAAA